jgi:phenylacetate-CoA ligase
MSERHALETSTWSRFRAALARWYETNPFYRDLLRGAGVGPADVRTRDDLKRIPLTSKLDLIRDQHEAPPFGRRLGVDAASIVRIAMTGGTTGHGRTVQPHTREDQRTCDANMATTLRWAGFRDGDAFAFNVPLSNHTGGWMFLGGAMVDGRAPYLIGHESFAGRLELMRMFGVDGMYAAPSALNGLTATCHEAGMRPRDMFGDLRFILTGGEAYPVAFAARMQDEWGVRLAEGYGSTESGSQCAATCERGTISGDRRGMMHLFERDFLFEVIDPQTGDHVAAGETGHFVFTTLAKEASPMLRYDTGDRVTWLPHSACDCGRPYSGIEAGTVGRVDDMLKIKGVNIWPAEVDDVVFSYPHAAEYQGEVFIGARGRDEAKIKVAFAPDEQDPAARAEELSRKLRSALEVRFDVVPVAPGELPVFATSDKKARRWTDRRQEGLAS